MPHYSLAITSAGPLISLYISVSAPRREALIKAHKPIPAPVLTQLLVDTGASCTNIDCKIIGKLGLSPTGAVLMHTPSTGQRPVKALTYDIGLVLEAGGHQVASVSVIETDFSDQGFGGLLGRDVLSLARMTYSGPDNTMYLSF